MLVDLLVMTCRNTLKIRLNVTERCYIKNFYLVRTMTIMNAVTYVKIVIEQGNF